MSDERRIERRGASRQGEGGQRSVPGDVFLVLRIVHAALVASILLFGVMVVFVTRPPGDPVIGADIPVRAEPPGFLVPIMVALAATSLLAIYIVRRRMARDRDAVAATTPEASDGTRSRLYSRSIASWALAETIGLYGLVVGIIYRSPKPYLPFAAVSLLLMIVLAPRRRDIP